MSEYRAEQVFTPSAPQLGLNFSRRDEEDRLRDYLSEQGTQILVWGNTGVGKTSLVLKTLNSSYNFVRFQAEADSSFEEIVRFFSEQVAGARPQSKTVTSRRSDATKLGAPQLQFGIERTRIVEEVFVEERFSSHRFVETLGPEAWLLIVDDFEKIRDTKTQARLAQLSKALSDQAPYVEGLRTSMRMVFIGIAESAGHLLAGDPSTWGRIVSLELPPLTGAQIRSILVSGFELLGLDYDNAVLGYFTEWADGYARYAHALGLEAARGTLSRGEARVGQDQIRLALHAAVQRWEDVYHGTLERATRSRAGSAQVHRKIIEGLAHTRRRSFTIDDVLSAVKAIDPKITRKQQISNALSELTKEDKRGALLKQVANRIGEYTFTDSLLKAYARMYFTSKAEK